VKKILSLTLLSAVAMVAQSPHLAGVWKADLQKSKLSGPGGPPPPTNYLVIFEEKTALFDPHTKEEAPQLIETTGTWGQREDRSVLKVFTNNKPIVLEYHGVPTRMTAGWEGNTLKINGETAGHPNTFTRTYVLSPDGQTLTVDTESNNGGKQSSTQLLLEKQPESVGEPLRKPEELAGAHFKNVTTASLKNLPVSEFIDQMHYYAWSLNRNCEFCHVARKFDADDKNHKKIARKMIDMVAAIDQNNFEGKPHVRCFTCHGGHAHPLTHQQFEDEAAAEKEALAKAAAEQQKQQQPQH
jgi:hypothetical protein